MKEQLSEPAVEYAERDERLSARITLRQKELDGVPFTGVSLDQREAVEASLNQDWAYHNEDCIFSGIGRLATGLQDPNAREDFIDYGVGRSVGLVVVAFGKPAHQRWIISYALEESATTPGTIVEGGYVFLEASRAIITPLAELEESFEALQQPHETLSRLSDNMVNDLHDEHFLQLTATEQRNRIDHLVNEARDLAEDWGGIKDKQVVVAAERGFVLDVSAKGSAYYRAVQLESSPIGGICRGLDALVRRQLLGHYPITDTTQLVDNAAGLFLVVEPGEDTAGRYGVRPGNYVYLPISGQELGVAFLEPPDATEEE
jgi:hypothetical protein